MANLDQPQGAVPYGKVVSCGVYESGSAVYPGDFVALASDGQVDAGADSGSLLGVAMNYCSAAGQELRVADHPDQKFIVQAAGADVDLQTDIGQLCDIEATAGSSTYKASRHELDFSDTGTGQLRLLGIDPRPNNALGEFVDCIVVINAHQLATGGAAI